MTQVRHTFAGLAQLIRALAFQAGGCGFESHVPLKKRLKEQSTSSEWGAGPTLLVLSTIG